MLRCTGLPLCAGVALVALLCCVMLPPVQAAAPAYITLPEARAWPLPSGSNHSLTMEDDVFKLDGHQFFIISCGVHYFCVAPGNWRDRLLRSQAMGCNAIQTY